MSNPHTKILQVLDTEGLEAANSSIAARDAICNAAKRGEGSVAYNAEKLEQTKILRRLIEEGV